MFLKTKTLFSGEEPRSLALALNFTNLFHFTHTAPWLRSSTVTLERYQDASSALPFPRCHRRTARSGPRSSQVVSMKLTTLPRLSACVQQSYFFISCIASAAQLNE